MGWDKPQILSCGLEVVVGYETETSIYSKMSEVNPQKTSCRTAQDYITYKRGLLKRINIKKEFIFTEYSGVGLCKFKR